MKGIRKFTLEKARELLKRELGIGGTKLVAPPEMNRHPEYPYYVLQSGNLHVSILPITARAAGIASLLGDEKVIQLNVNFNDGVQGIEQYFYADTLEEATEYTEFEVFYALWEKTGELKQLEPILNRKGKIALDACRLHYSGKWWHVKLPQEEEMWIRSATPRRDLIEKGYSAFALSEVSGDGMRSLEPTKETVSARLAEAQAEADRRNDAHTAAQRHPVERRDKS